MAERKLSQALSRLLSDYGMALVLLLLCVYFSCVTYAEQDPGGADAARQLAPRVIERVRPGGAVLIVARDTAEDAVFVDAHAARLEKAGVHATAAVKGPPSEVRAALQKVADKGGKLDAIAANQATSLWAVVQDVGENFPTLGDVPVLTPERYHWPSFLMPANLRNIANQIAVIAILAVGMTFVVITGGIDLSVGSLIALSAVTAALLIRDVAGAEDATASGMVLCSLAGIGACAGVGLFSGTMVTFFRVPAFIVTLAMMLVARGLAGILSEGQSVFQVPQSYDWLGRGADLLDVPNGVVLMGALYLAAHVVMSRTTLGRYVYAVGGNPEAARLSGVPVEAVLLFAYTVSGCLAGLGGIVMASKLRSGDPIYGQMYELYVVAAVVVGGTSLSGGEGKVLGTLIGAFIIAVIQNGMNLTGVRSYPQMVVFGLVILGAVLLDRFRKHGWRMGRAP
jgi:ribose transport system permease protein